jgi:hypothetical protein
MSCTRSNPGVRKCVAFRFQLIKTCFQRCWPQSELDNALIEAKNQFEEMEFLLASNYDLPGLTLTESDAAFTHFQTHDIHVAAFEENRFAHYVTDALLSIKNNKSMTKSQFEMCLKTQKYSTSGFCTPRNVSCNPSNTK